MYNQFYALNQRPFSTTPNPNCFYSAPAIQEAHDSIMRTVEEGQGMAVVTSAAGLGKTILLKKLAADLSEHYKTLFLSTAGYPTRRDFLQAILFEFKQPYSQMGEQELRLQLVSAAQTVLSEKQGTVILVDEAHCLNDRLLDELRSLTNFAEGANPLFRIVLAGQLKLEERLTSPRMEAFNQRLCCQVMLEPFSCQESYDYIAHRMEWSGGEIELCFTDEALDLIVRASDGSPRCLNHLCDHSLLLSFVDENKPVTVEAVRHALEDLQRLPLHWNIPQQFDTTSTSIETSLPISEEAEFSEMASFETEPENLEQHAEEHHTEEFEENTVINDSTDEEWASHETSIETNTEANAEQEDAEEAVVEEPATENQNSSEMFSYEVGAGTTVEEPIVNEIPKQIETPESKIENTTQVEDIVVNDHYAQLDHQLQAGKTESSPEPFDSPEKASVEQTQVIAEFNFDAVTRVVSERGKEAELLTMGEITSAIESEVEDEIDDDDEETTLKLPSEITEGESLEDQLEKSIDELQDETRSLYEEEEVAQYDVVQPPLSPVSELAEEAHTLDAVPTEVGTETDEERPYETLFSELSQQED